MKGMGAKTVKSRKVKSGGGRGIQDVAGLVEPKF